MSSSISTEKRAKSKFPDNPRIVFMGTPEFAVPSFKALMENGSRVLAVVTQPDRPKGRGRKMTPPPVKEAALSYGLPVYQPERASEQDFCEDIRSLKPHVLFVVAFGQVLKNQLLGIPSWGVLNTHASLLPRYRGAAPIHWAVLNKEEKTGLTAMKMDEGLDTGPILLQEETGIFPGETTGELHNRLAAMSGDFILKTLNLLKEGKIQEIPQDHSCATYAPKIDRGMSRIKWSRPAESVSALMRGLDPWPGAFSTLGSKEIKLFSPKIRVEDRLKPLPGRIIGFKEDLVEVETGDGVVGIAELQAPGKKRLSAGDFLRGFKVDKGAVFGE
ncbi:methionyl-tRNA formyltransferase [Thermodesulfobacteriota bacterium]